MGLVAQCFAGRRADHRQLDRQLDRQRGQRGAGVGRSGGSLRDHGSRCGGRGTAAAASELRCVEGPSAPFNSAEFQERGALAWALQKIERSYTIRHLREALTPEQLAETLETDPSLEATGPAVVGRAGGAIVGTAAQGVVHPGLPFVTMVSQASSEAGDAAVAEAKLAGETDPARLQAIREKAAAHGAEFALATIPLYLAGMKGASKLTHAALPQGSAAARAAFGTAAAGGANVVAGGVTRAAAGGNVFPTSEELGTELGFAAIHGGGEFAHTKAGRAAVAKQLETVSDQALADTIHDPEALRRLPFDPRLVTEEIIRRANAKNAPEPRPGEQNAPGDLEELQSLLPPKKPGSPEAQEQERLRGIMRERLVKTGETAPPEIEVANTVDEILEHLEGERVRGEKKGQDGLALIFRTVRKDQWVSVDSKLMGLR